MMRASVLVAGLVALLCAGCYRIHPSSGGGETKNHTRAVNPNDVALPPGYRIEAVAKDLTFPTGVTFDETGNVYIVESGYCYGEVWTTPKLIQVTSTGPKTIASGSNNGPWTGVTFHKGSFYIAEGGTMEGGRILKVSRNGNVSVLVRDLPSYGDHHTDGPVIGPDGYLYFGIGTASNSGIVGEDNAKFGWLKRHPRFHDIPGQDVVLAGENFQTKNPLNSEPGKVSTGAFLPFGTSSTPGQIVKGQTKCSGSILRVRLNGGEPELVAWGFRNPFGLAFSPDGKLFVTDNSYDDRGSRPVWGTPDVLWQVKPGTWYGWPDFCGGEPLTHSRFKPPGKMQPRFVLAKHPNPPPRPVARFGVHASADGFDFSRNGAFGHIGEAFVAELGDEAPATGKVMHPVGFKVVRVDVQNGTIEDFATNRGRRNGPASRLKSGGLERPVAARFDPTGRALYVADFGVILHDKKGAKPQQRTGVLWKITKE